MWLPANVVSDVNRLVRVYYIDRLMTQNWNEHREKDEIRMLTGWCWSTRDGRHYRQGFKTASVCYRDAYYTLVRKENAPVMPASRDQRKAPPPLRLVKTTTPPARTLRAA